MIAVAALVLLFVLVLLGMPLIIALITTVASYLLITGGWPLAFPQQVHSGVSGFILLALPLFILAGSLMNAGGISTRMFDFARAVVGPLRGGLAQVNVMLSMMFGGLIGTSVADIAGTGSVLIPAMKEDGYPPSFAAALTATSSGVGPLIPPSTPMILYASVTGTSLGALFIAGILPGLLLGGTLMLIVALLARRRGWRAHGTFSWSALGRATRRAILPFGLPIIILGGIVFGVVTPTESGALAAAYAFLLAGPVYRQLSWRQFYQLLVRASALTGEVMLIVGVSVALGWALSSARVPQNLATALEAIVPGDSAAIKLIVIMLLAVVAGMILDPLIPVVVPITFPTVIAFGIDPLQFGVLMVMAVVIGQVTPPVAITLVMSGKIADVDLYHVIKANTPFLLGLITLTLALIFVPAISTWLPSLLAP